MNKRTFLGIMLVGSMLFAGCYRTVYRGPELDFPVAMNQADPGGVVVGHFTERVWNHYFVSGMLPTSSPDLQAIIRKHVPPGHEVRNLSIRHERSFVNGLISYLVSGMYSPMTTTISGDVVRIAKEGL